MQEVIADKNYFYDAEGNVTTDESKGERWLAREGANVLYEHRETLKAFLGKGGKAKPAESETEAVETGEEVDGGEKASSPSANKKVLPSKNKGAKK